MNWGVVRVSGRKGTSGSLGSGRSAGYAIGEERTSPRQRAIAGIRSDRIPGLAQARAGSPDPSRGTCKSQRRAFTDTRPQRAPPSERQRCVNCAIIWVCQVHGARCAVCGAPRRLCHNMGVPWHSPNRCTRMQEMRPNHRRAAHQSEPAGRAHAPLCLTPINSEAPPHHPIGTATKRTGAARASCL